MRLELDARRWDALRKICDESLQPLSRRDLPPRDRVAPGRSRFQSGRFQGRRGAAAQAEGPEKTTPRCKKSDWFPQVWVLLAETQWRLKATMPWRRRSPNTGRWDPQSPLLYQADEVLGRSFKSQANWAEARAAFERVLKDPQGKLSETAAKSQFLLADTYFWEKNYPDGHQGVSESRHPVQIPRSAGSGAVSGRRLSRGAAKWKDAAKTYDEMLRRFPNYEKAGLARERLDAVRKRLASG